MNTNTFELYYGEKSIREAQERGEDLEDMTCKPFPADKKHVTDIMRKCSVGRRKFKV